MGGGLRRKTNGAIAILKTITDLERIGDECEKIACIAARLANDERPVVHYRNVKHLGRITQTMLHKTLDAFAPGEYELRVLATEPGTGAKAERRGSLTAPEGKLICEYQFNLDLPKSDKTHNIDIPESATKKKAAGPDI